MVEFTSTARERSDGVVQITVPALIRSFVKLNVPLKVTIEVITDTKETTIDKEK
jgi:hypothetical protein